MNILKNIARFKNVLWALGIFICLIAVLFGLLFAMFIRFSDPVPAMESGVISSSDGIDGGMEGMSSSGTGTLLTAGETSDGGQNYLDSLTFLCDSATVGLRDYGVLSGGADTQQVWGTESGSLSDETLADCTIVYPATGETVTPAVAAAQEKPSRLLIMIGMDSLSSVTQEQFISSYESLVKSIQSASPNSTIVCCTLTSVTSAYTGSSVTSTEAVAEANEWVKTVCVDTGAIYMNTAEAVCDVSTTLLQDYASANNKTLNTAGLTQILQYVRTHVV